MFGLLKHKDLTFVTSNVKFLKELSDNLISVVFVGGGVIDVNLKDKKASDFIKAFEEAHFKNKIVEI